MDMPLKLSFGKRSKLRNLQTDCESSGPSDQEALIREAQPIFAEVTKEMGLPSAPLQNAGDLEVLLDDSAYETAALQLLNKGSAFMLSQGKKGLCFASVQLPGEDEEKSAVADTVALSLIAAEASAILSATD